jgi:FtsH-binding integral membrane protein
MGVEILLALLAGPLFALIGVAFRMAERRNIPLTRLMIVSTLAGSLFFFSKIGAAGMGHVPPAIWAWSLALGCALLTVLLACAHGSSSWTGLLHGATHLAQAS